jgi:hypothetical protein
LSKNVAEMGDYLMDEEQYIREQYEGYLGTETIPPESNFDEQEVGCGRYFFIILGIAVVFLGCNVWYYFSLIGTFSNSQGSLNIFNEAQVNLDVAAIEDAAAVLRQNFNFDIDIYIVQNYQNIEPFSTLSGYILQSNMGNMPPNKLVIVVGIDDQYSEISWGANLERLDGDLLRREELNPRLFERDYTGAIVNTFNRSLERLQDRELASEELFRRYSRFLERYGVVLLIIALIGVAVFLQWQGYLGDGSSNWSSGSGSSSWRSNSSSSNSRSSSGSSNRRSSSGSSSRRSGGGSSKGSWKN